MVETDKITDDSCNDEVITKQRSHVNRNISERDNNNVPAKTDDLKKSSADDAPWGFKDLVWKNIAFFVYLHLGSFYGLYLIFTGQCKIATILMAALLVHWGLLGITAGAHRLWSHKGYKATWQLKLILTFFNTIAHQNGIWVWVHDHRVHHKYQDTHADPHNAGRGLFFSHFGWLMVKERPEVDEKRRTIDMSDCLADPFVMIQKKYYWTWTILISIVLPTWILCYYFGETLDAAWHVGFVLRHLYTLHDTFLINSYAHAVGSKPYDKSIRPTDHRLLAIMTQGEGWHNYHHVFPWDYKTAELGNYRYNISTAFIDFFAKIGWAYDLKTVSKETIQKRMARSGDFNVNYSDAKIEDLMRLSEARHEHTEPTELIWGWDDADFNEGEKKTATILNKATL